MQEQPVQILVTLPEWPSEVAMRADLRQRLRHADWFGDLEQWRAWRKACVAAERTDGNSSRKTPPA